jgi:HEAT repeat protein
VGSRASKTGSLSAAQAQQKDEVVEIRCQCALALGKIGDPQAIEPLRRLQNDSHPAVRDAALDALDLLERPS